MAHGVSKPVWRPATVFCIENIENIEFSDNMVDRTRYMMNHCEARQVKSWI
jgi:hypothetical protein